MGLVDLSHYDLKDNFTAFEIANLIAGDEPDSIPHILAASSKARVFYKIIERAYDRACTALHVKLGLEGADLDKHIFFGISAKPHMLPSCSLLEHSRKSREDREDNIVNDLHIRYPFEDQFFLREDIEKWLSLTDYKGECYFLNKDDVLTTNSNASSTDSANLLSLSSAKIEQLQRENTILQEKLAELQDKPLGAHARNSYLVLIAALCDYSDVKTAERGATTQIVNMTEEIGTPVSDDTVRRILSQIPDALVSRKK
ncbi:MAG TPA: hypothetical protein VF445_16985 [Bordetella sp.]|uniref:hypothetical protein n=1 Tax=Bordetella sp. TaxID=28081 RepID=UPI002ED5C20D